MNRRWLRLPLSRATLERDIDEELAFHQESRLEELRQQGVGEPEAQQILQREFGDLHAARSDLIRLGRRRIRVARMGDVLKDVGQQFRWAWRMVVREPGLAAAVIVALAVGVGVNAVMFSVTDRLLFRAPPGIEEPETVGRLFLHMTLPQTGTLRQPVTTWPVFEELRRTSVAVEAGAFSATHTASLGAGAEARAVRVVMATGSFFTTLRTRPGLGRFFTDAESSDGSPVAVVSRPFWEQVLGGGSLDGRRVRIGRRVYTVVGVAPAGFTGVDLAPVDVWLPMAAAAPELGGSGWNTDAMQWLQVVIRRGDVPARSAEAMLTRAARDVHPIMVLDDQSHVTLESLVPARGLQPAWSESASSGRVALWLSGVSAVVLLIACANVANLLLARASRRRREIGVRLALGIGRGRLASQLIIETLVLAALAGVTALLLATWAGTVLRELLLPDVEWAGRPVLDGRLLVFAGILILGSVLLCGLAPAWFAFRQGTLSALRTAFSVASSQSYVRRSLVVAQAALSVAVLVGAGLFVMSLHQLRSVDTGFAPDGLALARWPAGSLQLSRSERDLLYEESVERLRAMSDVDGAAMAAVAPLSGSISVSVRRDPAGTVQGTGIPVNINAVSPDYLSVVGTRVVRGRGILTSDTDGSEPVAVISEGLAAALWPGGDPLHDCLHVDRGPGTACARVIGIMQDVRGADPNEEPVPSILVALAQQPELSAERQILIRLRGGSDGVGRIRQALQTLRPGLAHVSITTYDDLLAPAQRPWRLGARLFTAFGCIALLLVSVGIYGVVAYDIARRQRELSVRVALGAGRGAIARLVLGNAGTLVVGGSLMGLALVLIAADRLQPLLFRVSARDPYVLGASVALIALSGLTAAAVPAWRASAADPLLAMKDD